MKKMLFGLIATVLFSVSGNAQKLISSSKQTVVNSQIVALVSVSQSVYSKGQSYDDFIKTLSIPTPVNPYETKLMQTVYKDLQNNTPSCDILKRDSSELINLGIKYGSQIGTTQARTKCGWFCQLLLSIAELIIDVIRGDQQP
jgi:hypothetical protein